jgi:hypothetical protein
LTHIAKITKSSFPSLENPYQCFLIFPDWLNQKRPIISDRLKRPQTSVQFCFSWNASIAEMAVSQLKTKIFNGQLIQSSQLFKPNPIGEQRFHDISVSNNCNANRNNETYLGSAYINGSGLDGDKFFTGSLHFKIKDIEVFEITN